MNYKSLYKQSQLLCLKHKVQTPGPGYYEPVYLKTENKEKETMKED